MPFQLRLLLCLTLETSLVISPLRRALHVPDRLVLLKHIQAWWKQNFEPKNLQHPNDAGSMSQMGVKQ